jgi:metal-sulfur cluster biosynthetic enzyme
VSIKLVNAPKENPAYSRQLSTRRATVAIVLIAVVALELAIPNAVWGQADSKAQGAHRGISAAARTDSFETKMQLLQAAWQHGDFDLARSLTHSLRDTVIQTQTEEQTPDESLLTALRDQNVDSLGTAWQQWARGWKHYKVVSMEETAGEPRTSEPVEVTLSFPAKQVTSLIREIRIARIEHGKLIEVPSQVFNELRRGDECFCTILWMADSQPKQKQDFLVFYGNPDAELPEYPSDLETQGEGFGLDISNAYFKASLSRQTGQLERLTLRREHGMEFFSGGQGHGEPPGIDWAHDYVDGDHFQKFRISLWDRCPDYEVIKGPLCTIVRRWGFPHSPVHPVYSPARLNVYVEYRFYSGLPWFHKSGSMKAVQNLEAAALRDDEWVFSGHSFTDKLWMARDGKLRSGDVDADHQNDLWGVGFYNKDSKDSFMALFLEHKADGLPELNHTGVPTLSYRWHGQLWSRYPLPVKSVPAGTVLHQKNAYLSIPFTEPEGTATIEQTRRCMMNPLIVSASSTQEFPRSVTEPVSTSRLARPGEAGEQSSIKQQVWEALRDCKDAQLYKADINVVDLGLVYDIRVRGDVVTVVMAMPHRGRPLLGYFIDGSTSVHPTKSVPVRERLMQIPGVRHVAVEQTWSPGWSSNHLTNVGRKKLGLD